MRKNRRRLTVLLLTLALVGVAGTSAHADPKPKSKSKAKNSRTVVHKGPRGKVVVHKGFPIRRGLPKVYVRAPKVRIRVTPRVYLPRVVFPARVIHVRPAPAKVVWYAYEPFVVDDGWTEVAFAVSSAGAHLDFELDGGPARVSFAEVVYDDGETQVVDFDDRVYVAGYYPMVTLERPRPVDHVRLVASAEKGDVRIGFHLAL